MEHFSLWMELSRGKKTRDLWSLKELERTYGSKKQVATTNLAWKKK